jgi:hypothetical protein
VILEREGRKLKRPAQLILDRVCRPLGHVGMLRHFVAAKRARSHRAVIEWQPVDEVMKQVPEPSGIGVDRVLSFQHQGRDRTGLQAALGHLAVANDEVTPELRREAIPLWQ